jgi:hypothetical protein
VPLLYHRFFDLSSIICPGAKCAANYNRALAHKERNMKGENYRMEMGYCIAHNPLLFQPLRHWFTFIYRKCEHLAVGSLGQGLTRSRGHPLLWSPCPPLLYLYYSTFSTICQVLFCFCGITLICFPVLLPKTFVPWSLGGVHPSPDIDIIAQNIQFVNPFFKKFLVSTR